MKKKFRDRGELEAAINLKAAKDPAFRRKLFKNPHEALEEWGVTIPQHVKINVHEEKANDWDLVIHSPKRNTKQFSEGELKRVSAGCDWQAASFNDL